MAAHRMLTIGVDVGGTKVLGLALGERGSTVAEARSPTPVGADAILACVVEVANKVMGSAGGEVAAIGVGMPGLVDRAGRLRFAPNLPGVVEVDLRAGLEPHFPDTALVFDNDATCAGVAEWAHGAAQGTSDAIFVSLGTGIGGGMVMGGQVFRGANGFAGEIGHMVVDPHGPPCPCGKRGCWERFASGSALGRFGREAAEGGRAPRWVELAGDYESVRGEHVVRAAQEGDPPALEVIAQFGWWLSLGLANLANAFDPEVFVLGGGLVEAGDLLFAPARAAFAELVEANEHRPPIAIVPAQLGERAGAIGAAVMARNVTRGEKRP